MVIIPAPYEGTVSYVKGTAKGPEAIRAASPFIELYDFHLEAEVYKLGIHGLPLLKMPEEPWPAALAVKAAVVEAIETGRHPVLVGGEHSLTLGAVSACLEGFPNLTVLQLDAHADLREQYQGDPFSHACVMRRINDLGVKAVPAGIRSLSRQEKEWIEQKGLAFISAQEIITSPRWIEKTLEALSSHVYVTVDVDVLDPSQMPATGYPEPGGITYLHLVELALALRKAGKHVVGFDLMELAPLPGLHFPQYLAASLIYTMIGAFWLEPQPSSPARDKGTTASIPRK